MVTSNEWKQHVLAEARETSARKPEPYEARDEPLYYATHDPADDEPEPEYEPQLDTAPAVPPFDWRLTSTSGSRRA